MLKKHVAILLSLLSLAIALAEFAPVAMADDNDPPSRVARLAYSQGSVSFQPAGTDDWVAARINRPVTTGDQLWSDRDGRVELQLDGSFIRLSNNTGFSFLNLSDNVTQIQLSSGTISVRVRRLDQTETYEVDTPNLAFSIQSPGIYRISVNEAGDATAIRIRSGVGEVTGEGTAYTLGDNDSYTFGGSGQLYAEPNDGGYNEEFDNWASQRDRRWENSQSARYVSADVVGYDDLDDHGEWRPTSEYGTVWFPRTAYPDWAPYHYGHWAYIEPWGYTWVDDEPWGFAPFHYGRWVSYEGRWGWVPAPPRVEGIVYVRPVYAPALVAWVGGPHFAIGIGVAGGGYGPGVSVGWFPLGPSEVYVPSYRVSRTYVENVNVSNTRVTNVVVNNYYNTTIVNNNANVTNVKYVNQGVRGAVTATTAQAFTSAQPVARNVVKVDEREVASAPVRAFTPAAVPAKQAVLGTATAAAAKPPAAVERRAVVAKVAPPPPPPSFEKKQEAIKNNGGKPLSVAQARQIQPVVASRPAPVKVAPAAKPVAPQAQANRPGQPNRPGPPTGQPQPGQRPNPPPKNEPAPAQVAPNTGNRPNEPANRPPNANTPPERPANPNEASRPTQPPNRPSQPPEANRPSQPPVHPNEIPPPAPRPAPQPGGNAEQDRRHQLEQEQLRAKQEEERRSVQQKQEQEHQAFQKQQADAARKQQVEQQHQQQTQQLQQKHEQEQKALDQKQQQEREKKPKSQNDQHN